MAAIEQPPIPFVQTGAYPVRAGNLLRPLVDGEPAFRRVCEAIQNARPSVWVTVTVMWPEFRMPDGQGSALDVLDRAAARGLDVRVLFWRPDQETARYFRTAFWGSAEQRQVLAARQSGIKARWDRAKTGYCQHQKSWLLMPAEPDEVRTLASPERAAILAQRAELGRFENFTLAGLAGMDADGCRHAVYVHSKLMIVDDAIGRAWSTGSIPRRTLGSRAIDSHNA